MLTTTPQTIRLADYQAPAFRLARLDLAFDLHPTATRVRATSHYTDVTTPRLRLDGRQLNLISIHIDGQPVAADRYALDVDGLTLITPPREFVLETLVEIDPAGNTALEGLYMSGGRFCTQCEAEGFRKVSYFPDRPDVLTRFTTRVTADRAAYPILLSNGNLIDSGDAGDGRHFALWEDPIPKPCYLFALVAGHLDHIDDQFTTMDGRTVTLKIFVDPGEAHKAHYAMDALKRSMRWDEEVYGRAYDLDLFMIVAVRDFNFGAMENKGLNIFNSAYLLADPNTATDADYEAIEAIVAHEYFHNWTGNRITCRDWFQLCLKEGLTVFRDQGFSADARGHAVCRIKDVKRLRARQFQEDAGPLAHPVRPDSYMEINNFYTATVYEKGAEVIRMLRTLLGAEGFRAGMDRYFDSCDGTATTIEVFLACFEAATGRDLSAFRRWYHQAGTPHLSVHKDWEAASGTMRLSVRQATRPTPGQPDKQPLIIPIRIGFIGSAGDLSRDELVVLDQAEQTFEFKGFSDNPAVSFLRGFSAPVTVDFPQPVADLAALMAHDSDLFTRWETLQGVATRVILARAAISSEADATALMAALIDALRATLRHTDIDAAFKALALGLPAETDLLNRSNPMQPDAIHHARKAVKAELATALRTELLAAYDQAAPQTAAFDVGAQAAGQRALRNTCLDLLTCAPDAQITALAAQHLTTAGDLTSELAGLAAALTTAADGGQTALAGFYNKWQHNPLVIDKWFALQARHDAPGALARIEQLTQHAAFDATNPNRLRAVIMTFSTGNPVHFHAADGAGYQLLADWALRVDPKNPALAARLLGGFETWKRLDASRQAHVATALQRVLGTAGLSKNAHEIAEKNLRA